MDFMVALNLDERELSIRRAFVGLHDEDLQRLASLRPIAEKHTSEVIEDFYRVLLSQEETRAMFPDPATLERAKRAQYEYFMGLFAGRCDLDYAADRLRVGTTHERIGLAPKWYIGAYTRYLWFLHQRLHDEIPNPEEREAAFESVHKMVTFDMTLAIDTYIAAYLDSLDRHRAAIRELSTPVIAVHEGVLLLPLVGALDAKRSEQVMEAVLLRVVEEQARVVILDIAGVPVVDTGVADHLLKTTAAVRLLGAQTVLTGISASVARTMVQLGVDVSTMHTRSRLAEGIQLALSIVGKTIQEVAG
jgi:rsbT co-antagonist protein RsbR